MMLFCFLLILMSNSDAKTLAKTSFNFESTSEKVRGHLGKKLDTN